MCIPALAGVGTFLTGGAATGAAAAAVGTAAVGLGVGAVGASIYGSQAQASAAKKAASKMTNAPAMAPPPQMIQPEAGLANRRERIDRMRQGLASTIRTGPRGLTGSGSNLSYGAQT